MEKVETNDMVSSDDTGVYTEITKPNSSDNDSLTVLR